MARCENCENEHDGSYASGRFCAYNCARGFSTKGKRKAINLKVMKTSKEAWKKQKPEYVAGLKTFMDIVSQDVRRRILRTMGIGCARCGWKEASCDFHHIKGRKIANANSTRNVTYICPNCHRLFHEKKIGPSDVKSLEEIIGDRWRECYLRL